jgi:hypothetical protein
VSTALIELVADAFCLPASDVAAWPAADFETVLAWLLLAEGDA